MDIAIPHIRGHWDSLDLRYTLRSIERFYPKVGELYLVGHVPDWYTGSRVKTTDPQEIDKPFMDSMSKLFEFARGYSGETFSWWDDDTLLLETYWPQNYHRDGQKKWGPSQYKRAWDNTRNVLSLMDIKPVRDFELHVPMVYGKSELLELETSDSILIRTLFGNAFQVESTPLEDQKVSTWEGEPSGKFLSTGDLYLGTAIARHWAERMFPDSSRWEK